ncbi:hypothetical protein Mpsy_0608 [Methanolobus psychrophilus R15]|nr:hypothetical protein Mpsy_0608 [Methanolobus psychrophilus R15]
MAYPKKKAFRSKNKTTTPPQAAHSNATDKRIDRACMIHPETVV